nr:hypothetical protein OG513_07735 [Streptomyces sp. NBC_00998]
MTPEEHARALSMPEVVALLSGCAYHDDDTLWVHVDDEDRGYDLFEVTGLRPGACQPTLALRWVEFVSL